MDGASLASPTSPMDLIIPMDREQPAAWDDIMSQTYDFLRRSCHNGPATRAGRTARGAGRTTRGVRKATRAAKRTTRSAANAKSTPRKGTRTPESTCCRLLSLPPELFIHIFRYAMEPHTLDARITGWSGDHLSALGLRLGGAELEEDTNWSGDKQLVFYKPRTWGNIVLFRVSRTFREAAIQHYGLPCPDAFPFNPAADSVRLSAETSANSPTGYFAQPWVCIPRLDMLKRAWADQHRAKRALVQSRCELWEGCSWMREEGVYFTHADEYRATPMRPPTRLSPDFRARIRNVVVAGADPTFFRLVDWCKTWQTVRAQLPAVRHVRLDLLKHDDETTALLHQRMEANAYRAYTGMSDTVLVEALAAEGMLCGALGQGNPFPDLGALEIHKVTPLALLLL